MHARKQTVIRRFQLYYGFNDMACYAWYAMVCHGNLWRVMAMLMLLLTQRSRFPSVVVYLFTK